MVSFNIEATRNPIRLARTLRQAGSKVGLALNPSTPPDALAYLLDEVDYFLVMTVEPGFAGQAFLPRTLAKIAAIRRLGERGSATCIEVDGNLDAARSSQCIDQGASILVAGTSSVFRSSSDVLTAAIEFRRQVDSLQAQGRDNVSTDHNNQDGTR
jgi:ribulose-phosphate 3-epimerase